MKMVSEGKIYKDLGYHYFQIIKEYVKFHVDDHIDFQSQCDHLPYGGNLSVRKDPQSKPIIILGQDEAIFTKQFVFSRGCWVMEDDSKQMMPKDEGQGEMISSFVSCEIGYGFTPSQDIFDEVNRKQRNCKYSDEEAAEEKKGTSCKSNLTKTPFTAELEYGCNHDGYWTYEFMVC